LFIKNEIVKKDKDIKSEKELRYAKDLVQLNKIVWSNISVKFEYCKVSVDNILCMDSIKVGI
jgi:hypothetical protein